MHTASYDVLIKPEESAECHQTLFSQVVSRHETRQIAACQHVWSPTCGLLLFNQALAQIRLTMMQHLPRSCKAWCKVTVGYGMSDPPRWWWDGGGGFLDCIFVLHYLDSMSERLEGIISIYIYMFSYLHFDA